MKRSKDRFLPAKSRIKKPATNTNSHFFTSQNEKMMADQAKALDPFEFDDFDSTSSAKMLKPDPTVSQLARKLEKVKANQIEPSSDVRKRPRGTVGKTNFTKLQEQLTKNVVQEKRRKEAENSTPNSMSPRSTTTFDQLSSLSHNIDHMSPTGSCSSLGITAQFVSPPQPTSLQWHGAAPPANRNSDIFRMPNSPLPHASPIKHINTGLSPRASSVISIASSAPRAPKPTKAPQSASLPNRPEGNVYPPESSSPKLPVTYTRMRRLRSLLREGSEKQPEEGSASQRAFAHYDQRHAADASLLPFGIDSSSTSGDSDEDLFLGTELGSRAQNTSSLFGALRSERKIERSTRDPVAARIFRLDAEHVKCRRLLAHAAQADSFAGRALDRRRLADAALVQSARESSEASMRASQCIEERRGHHRTAARIARLLRTADGGGQRQHQQQQCGHVSEAGGCESNALPYANYCSKHILYNTSQLLFAGCGGTNPDQTPCAAPILDPTGGGGGEQLCALHSRLAAVDTEDYPREFMHPKKKRSKHVDSCGTLFQNIAAATAPVDNTHNFTYSTEERVNLLSPHNPYQRGRGVPQPGALRAPLGLARPTGGAALNHDGTPMRSPQQPAFRSPPLPRPYDDTRPVPTPLVDQTRLPSPPPSYYSAPTPMPPHLGDPFPIDFADSAGSQPFSPPDPFVTSTYAIRSTRASSADTRNPFDDSASHSDLQVDPSSGAAAAPQQLLSPSTSAMASLLPMNLDAIATDAELAVVADVLSNTGVGKSQHNVSGGQDIDVDEDLGELPAKIFDDTDLQLVFGKLPPELLFGGAQRVNGSEQLPNCAASRDDTTNALEMLLGGAGERPINWNEPNFLGLSNGQTDLYGLTGGGGQAGRNDRSSHQWSGGGAPQSDASSLAAALAANYQHPSDVVNGALADGAGFALGSLFAPQTVYQHPQSRQHQLQRLLLQQQQSQLMMNSVCNGPLSSQSVSSSNSSHTSTNYRTPNQMTHDFNTSTNHNSTAPMFSTNQSAAQLLSTNQSATHLLSTNQNAAHLISTNQSAAQLLSSNPALTAALLRLKPISGNDRTPSNSAPQSTQANRTQMYLNGVPTPEKR